jgi:hypothetical protein
MPTTLYVWDVENDSLIEELDGSGNSIVTYTQTPNQFGGTISEDRGGSTSYYHYDGLGSTLAQVPQLPLRKNFFLSLVVHDST